MTLYEYKLEHFGKVLFREPTMFDWHWETKNYNTQYYLGAEKPKTAFITNNADYSMIAVPTRYYKRILINQLNNKTLNADFYFDPPPTKPIWISENMNMNNIRNGKYKKLTLLEVERLEVVNKKFPSVGTNYIKCLIVTPHDNRTHVDWVLEKWVTPFVTDNSIKELKQRLFREFLKEKEKSK